MADEETTTKKVPTKKKGLPPISPRNNNAETTDETRPDVGGSKTSLIKEDGTPRKKGKKKKGAKKARDGSGEPAGGFKGYNKAQLTKRMIQEQEEKAVEPEQPTRTTMEFGLATHRVFKTLCLFLHGLTAGLALWEIVIVYVLAQHPDTDFLDHYEKLSLPVQCVFYLLFALCAISACDRFDIGNPTRRFVVQALTLQNGAVSIFVYLAGLVLSLSTIDVEDRMHLRERTPRFGTAHL
nr:hypothetical protein BaRGS_030253 [Batillaria attramentaria]